MRAPDDDETKDEALIREEVERRSDALRNSYLKWLELHRFDLGVLVR